MGWPWTYLPTEKLVARRKSFKTTAVRLLQTLLSSRYQMSRRASCSDPVAPREMHDYALTEFHASTPACRCLLLRPPHGRVSIRSTTPARARFSATCFLLGRRVANRQRDASSPFGPANSHTTTHARPAAVMYTPALLYYGNLFCCCARQGDCFFSRLSSGPLTRFDRQ